MCGASANAKKVDKAKPGKSYRIGKTQLHGFGVLHYDGVNPTDCIVCPDDGMTMTLQGIPTKLQKIHGIGATEVVTFVDASPEYVDHFRFEGGKLLPVSVFAGKNITVYAGLVEVKQEPDKIEKRRVAPLKIAPAGVVANVPQPQPAQIAA